MQQLGWEGERAIVVSLTAAAKRRCDLTHVSNYVAVLSTPYVGRVNCQGFPFYHDHRMTVTPSDSSWREEGSWEKEIARRAASYFPLKIVIMIRTRDLDCETHTGNEEINNLSYVRSRYITGPTGNSAPRRPTLAF